MLAVCEVCWRLALTKSLGSKVERNNTEMHLLSSAVILSTSFISHFTQKINSFYSPSPPLWWFCQQTTASSSRFIRDTPVSLSGLVPLSHWKNTAPHCRGPLACATIRTQWCQVAANCGCNSCTLVRTNCCNKWNGRKGAVATEIRV